MASRYTCFLLFWKPAYKLRPMSMMADHVVVPVQVYTMGVGFPKLAAAVNQIAPGYGEFARRVESLCSADINKELRAYFILRVWFLVMIFLTLLVGVIDFLFSGNIGSPIWALLWMCAWAIFTRILMNKMMRSLGEYEGIAKVKLAGLQRDVMGRGDVQIACGACLNWLEVYRAIYQPPAMDVPMGVPMGIPI